MGSPKERVHHSMSREGNGGPSNPLLLGSRRGGARERDEKRRVREERKEMEGSVVSS